MVDKEGVDLLQNSEEVDAKAEAVRHSKQLSDEELVALVCQGDQAAFELIFNRHRSRVTAIAGRFFQDHVEDIVQECFVRAYLGLRDFETRGDGSFPAWLAKIAFNTCYDELRRKGRRRESLVSELSETEILTLEALTSEAPSTSIESTTVTRDLANRLLARLSPEDRIVLVLLDVEEMSVQEIAKLMDWSAAKVKIRVFRARRDLRRLLAKFL